MKLKTLFILLALLSVTLAGCETTSGLGQDVENTGENIQEGVEDM